MRKTTLFCGVIALTLASCGGGSEEAGRTPTKAPGAHLSGTTAAVVTSHELLAANFDEGPGPFTVDTFPEFSYDLVDGTYRIRILAGESYPRSYAYLAREVTAVAVLVDVVEVTSLTTDDPDLVGVACSQDDGDGYYFTAENNGDYNIVKAAGGHPSIIKHDFLASIPGSGRIERLRLTCVGAPAGPTRLWASINGTTVTMLNDPQGFDAFTKIALTLAADRGTEAIFDNVLARVPGPEDF